MSTDEFKEKAAKYWEKIDVDAMQPIPHGEPYSAEVEAWRDMAEKKLLLLREQYERACREKNIEPDVRTRFKD